MQTIAFCRLIIFCVAGSEASLYIVSLLGLSVSLQWLHFINMSHASSCHVALCLSKHLFQDKLKCPDVYPRCTDSCGNDCGQVYFVFLCLYALRFLQEIDAVQKLCMLLSYLFSSAEQYNNHHTDSIWSSKVSTAFQKHVTSFIQNKRGRRLVSCDKKVHQNKFR